ncbi:PREDICTED: circadian clock-controlled protein-like [Vollenhovia emeryi]|uniref:circadian clock-controlled protein-like n=1 Tax=Vollenhovia emeryi TaxID=411798 RepID=UPI0005F37DE9|nr:PREDICTED: circadian clock-controlled protein-like [Vollenhovia emeryi]
MSFYALTLFCATAFVLAAADEDFDFPVTTCKHDADDYAGCMKNSMQDVWKNFIPGIPKFDVPPLDPYFIEQERALYEGNDMHADITITNTKVYGLANIRFLAVRPQYSDTYFRVDVDVDVPKVFIEGNYKAEGAFGLLQIHGDGYFNITAEDITATMITEGPVANDRWTIEHFHIDPEIGKLNVYFSDMFNGNAELNSAAMKFVNEYWPSMYHSVLPFLEKHWDEKVTELMNRVTSKVSFSKMFP